MSVTTELARHSNGTALSDAAARLVFRDRSGQPYGPAQLELVLALCAKHGLIAELRHIVLIQDAAYVTNAGLLHKAHTAGDLDGIDCRPATVEERIAYLSDDADSKTRVWRCDVYRRGHSRPYTGWGKASNSEPGAARNNPQEMASTRSVNRALRLAFNIGMTSVEEMPADDATRSVDQRTGEIRDTPPKAATIAPQEPAKAPQRQQLGKDPVPAPDALIAPNRAHDMLNHIRTIATNQGFEEAAADDWIGRRCTAIGKPDGLASLTMSEARVIVTEAQAADFSGATPPAADDGETF
jgi:hypothetical protein